MEWRVVWIGNVALVMAGSRIVERVVVPKECIEACSSDPGNAPLHCDCALVRKLLSMSAAAGDRPGIARAVASKRTGTRTG